MAPPQTRALALRAALAAALSLGCATTQRGPDDLVVRQIRIEGAQKIGAARIKSKILTSEPFWPWDVEVFDPNAWQADLRRIERYYESEGYYQAQVLDDEVVAVAPDAVSLRVRVAEGEPTRLAEVRIEGLAPLTERQRETLLEGFPLQEGEVFREEEWLSLKPLLRGRMREMGYAEAVVEGSVEVDVDSHLARALVEARPGQRYRFGEIFVATDANPRVPPRWIIEEARLAIARGAFYSETALAEAQSRVFKMGVFGGVKVNRGAPDRDTGTVPVVIDVREAPFRTLRAGGGVGLDQTRNEARVLLEYTNRNFFGGLRTFTTQVRAGYAFLPNVIDVLSSTKGGTHQEPLANLTAEFSQPRAFHPSLRYFVALEGEWRPELAFTLAGGQGKTGFAWSPNPSFVSQLTANLEAYGFFRGDAFLGGRTTEFAIGCPQTCFVAYPEAQLQWDRRMRQTPAGLRPDSVDPTSGYYLGLSVQYGQYGGNVDGALRFSPFVRVIPEARAYTSFLTGDRLTVGARVRAGGLFVPEDSPLDSPIFLRFYAGGGTSMRGYNNRRLSPLQLVPPDDSTADGEVGDAVPIGGERLFEASLEARYRLNSDFTLAVFGDAGLNARAATPDLATYMQYAVGFGLRYSTLVGPIRLDLAYRLPFGTPPVVVQTPDRSLVSPDGGGCFGLGDVPGTATSNPEGVCAIHLSIGEAF